MSAALGLGGTPTAPAVSRGDSAPADCASVQPTAGSRNLRRAETFACSRSSAKMEAAAPAEAPAPAEAEADKEKETGKKKRGSSRSPMKSPSSPPPGTLKSPGESASAIQRWQMSRMVPDTTTPRTPGSSRSLRSAGGHPAGVTGGPPSRLLWPKDFAADSARESDLEVLRIAARKAREERLKQEREAARIRKLNVQRGGRRTDAVYGYKG